MKRMVVAAIVLAGCADDKEPVKGDDDAHACTVRVELDGVETERLVAALEGPDRPTEVTTSRDGAATSRWTYEYGSDGRTLVQHQDVVGGTPGGPDGMIDLDTVFEHTPASTTVRYMAPGQDGGEVVTYSLDGAERIVRVVGASYTSDYELDADGAVTHRLDDALDPDVNTRYTRAETYEYDATHRLIARTTEDSRLGPAGTMHWVYDASPNGVVVTRSGAGLTMQWTYELDGAGRVTRAQEDGDGSVWSVDIAYAAGGAVTTHASRDGSDGWVYSFSGGCGYTPRVLQAPTSGGRPGATWLYQLPGIPDALQ